MSELLGKGVLVRPIRPEYTYTKLGAKRVDMLANAMFEGAREPIEAGGHIWDSTVITSFLSA